MKVAASIITGLLISICSAAQEIPLYTWRTHFSYTSITCMTESSSKIFAAAEVGLFSVDKLDGSVERFFVSDGFQDVDVSALYFHEATRILMIGYTSGNLDLVVDGSVVNFDLNSDSQVIGSKSINDITSINNEAFIATDYGILKFDLSRLEVRETYRELGMNASQISVNKLSVSGDSLYAATEAGIQSADFTNENLASFTSWKRYDTFTSAVVELAAANDRLYAIWNDALYAQQQGSWNPVSPASGFIPAHLGASDEGLLLIRGQAVEVMDVGNQEIRTVSSSKLVEAVVALTDGSGRMWVGDAATGLWAESGSELENFTPSGPERTVPFNLTYLNESIYALPGGFDALGRPLGNDFGYSIFSAGEWDNMDLEDFGDVTSAAGERNRVFIGSAGDGLLNLTDMSRYNSTNSPLVDGGDGIVIPDLAYDAGNLFVLNLGSPTSLLRLDQDENWQAYTMPVFARSATSLEASDGFAWLVIPASRGGGIYAVEPESGDFRYITDEANNGGLPSRNVGDVALDREGFLWIGTSRGVSIWFTPFQLTGSINATEPVFEGRPLLVDQEIYAIEVDGGNRKWIGTDQGAWLFDAFADELLLHFTRENSPLPSDIVRDITINEETGEVFFLTDAGMASYRADASEGSAEHRNVKIFPNPVEPVYQGAVGISGLVSDARIRITDSAGQLVYETRANGGTATWPVRQFPGGSLASGMYFVFSVSSDGSESYVGKIAVIR